MCDGHHHGQTPSRPFTRRQALASAGAGLLIAGITSPETAVARTGRTLATGASRSSRITGGTTLVHADLHNHTLLSDGDGDPALAFDSMRSAGLDVAALTDHATFSDNALGDLITDALPPDYHQAAGSPRRLEPHPRAGRRRRPGRRLHRDPRLRVVQPAARARQRLVQRALRRRAAGRPDGAVPRVAAPRARPGARRRRATASPASTTPAASRAASRSSASTRGCASGSSRWRCSTAATTTSSRGTPTATPPRSSPASTRAGAPGITGVTDEHGTDWGLPEGKGRTGLWVAEHTRAGVKSAMLARRFFATRTSGLRVDATASRRRGPAVPMGSELSMTSADVTFTLDLARDPDWVGRPLALQVLRPGPDVPEVVAVQDFAVGGLVDRHRAARRRRRRLGGAAGGRPDGSQRHPRPRRPPRQPARHRLHQPLVARPLRFRCWGRHTFRSP